MATRPKTCSSARIWRCTRRNRAGATAVKCARPTPGRPCRGILKRPDAELKPKLKPPIGETLAERRGAAPARQQVLSNFEFDICRYPESGGVHEGKSGHCLPRSGR